MRKIGWALFMILFLLTSCGKQETVELNLPQNVSLMTWKADNSHIKELKGTLTLNGKGVDGAVIQIGSKYVKSQTTGSFSFMLDASKIIQMDVTIVNADKASTDGKPLSSVEKALLKKQKAVINVSYPVKIEIIKEQNEDVMVSAKAIADNNEFPTLQTGKYVIKGTIKDSKGNRVKGAVVSTTNDMGEGWAKSNPSDEKGSYMVSLTPDNGEDSTFRVSVGSIQYTLPPNKVFRFPDNSSDEIDIVLPEKGTVINDNPPTLVARQISGGMNEGIIVGLEGVDPKDYHITVPTSNGEFMLTVSKKIWERHQQFFEKKINQYYEKKLTSHDQVPKEWLQK